jgi:hypothetical protein
MRQDHILPGLIGAPPSRSAIAPPNSAARATCRQEHRRLRYERGRQPRRPRGDGARSDAGLPCTTRISDLYKRPLQVSRYLRQFPSPRSPNSSLLRQACLNSAHTSLRAGLWQVSRYLRQFPSPRSPSASLFSQARRNCSHCPPRPSYTRTPPGPTSMDWEKAEIGITKRAAAAAAPNA